MTRRLWTATLVPSSPRYQDWRRILGTDEVPLKNAKSFPLDLAPEFKQVQCYELDMDRLSHAQIERLVAWIMERFGVPKREANGYIASNGFPIREADVSVCFSMRAFL